MNRQVLINAYAVCFKFGYQISHHERGMEFNSEKQCYILKSPNKPLVHLIETVLLGQVNCTGDWLVDAANVLETNATWLAGFVAGLDFKITSEDKPR